MVRCLSAAVLSLGVALCTVAGAGASNPTAAVHVRFLISSTQAEALVPDELRGTLRRLLPVSRRAVDHAATPVDAAIRDVVRSGIADGATTCYGYATVMNALGRELGLAVRLVAGTDGFSDLDTHTTVEVWAPAYGRWVIEDPTFGGTFTRIGDAEPLGSASLRDALVASTTAPVLWRSSHTAHAALPSDYYVDPLYLFRYIGAYASVDGVVMPVTLPDSTMLSSGVAVVAERDFEAAPPGRTIPGRVAAVDWTAARPSTLTDDKPPYAAAELWSGDVQLPATIDVREPDVVVWASNNGATVDGHAVWPVDGGALSPIVSGGTVELGGVGTSAFRIYAVKRFPAARER
jgi:transglutaminase superfamily protein